MIWIGPVTREPKAAVPKCFVVSRRTDTKSIVVSQSAERKDISMLSSLSGVKYHLAKIIFRVMRPIEMMNSDVHKKINTRNQNMLTVCLEYS